MKKEINEQYNFKTLTPDEGMVLFDGETHSYEVVMPIEGDESVWQEISDDTQTNDK